MSETLAIALGPPSLVVFTVLLARWNATFEFYRHRVSSLLYLGATLAGLVGSVFIAAFRMDARGEPSRLLLIVQIFALTYGFMFLLTPPLAQIFEEIGKTLSDPARHVIAIAIALTAGIGAIAAVVVFTAWWYALAVIAMSAVLSVIRFRYGPPVRAVHTDRSR